MQSFIQFSIIVLAIFFAYCLLKKLVERFISLKETSLSTPLSEFRESHASSLTIKKGLLDIQESITQKFEKMCVIDPIAYKNDPSIPEIISQYKKIISGIILDPHGYNVPSRELLGNLNPDYEKYIRNQARALDRHNFTSQVTALKKERKRIKDNKQKDELKDEIMGLLISQDIPPMLVCAAMTEKKLNTYTSEDWVSFSKKVKVYLEISDREIVTSFMENIDDLSVILDEDKFNQYSIFSRHNVPLAITKRLMNNEITDDQACRALGRTEIFHISLEEAVSDILAMDNKDAEEKALRKSYGFMGV